MAKNKTGIRRCLKLLYLFDFCAHNTWAEAPENGPESVAFIKADRTFVVAPAGKLNLCYPLPCQVLFQCVYQRRADALSPCGFGQVNVKMRGCKNDAKLMRSHNCTRRKGILWAHFTYLRKHFFPEIAEEPTRIRGAEDIAYRTVIFVNRSKAIRGKFNIRIAEQLEQKLFVILVP